MPANRRIPPLTAEAFPELAEMERLDKVDLLARKLPLVQSRIRAGAHVDA